MAMLCLCRNHILHSSYLFFFFFNDTATTEIYTLSLHDALPISDVGRQQRQLVPRSARDTALDHAIDARRTQRERRERQSRRAPQRLLERGSVALLRGGRSVAAASAPYVAQRAAQRPQHQSRLRALGAQARQHAQRACRLALE